MKRVWGGVLWAERVSRLTPGQAGHCCTELQSPWAETRFSGHSRAQFPSRLLLPSTLLPPLLLPHQRLLRKSVKCRVGRNSLVWFRGLLGRCVDFLPELVKQSAWQCSLWVTTDANPSTAGDFLQMPHLFLIALRVHMPPSSGAGWTIIKPPEKYHTFRNVT